MNIPLTSKQKSLLAIALSRGENIEVEGQKKLKGAKLYWEDAKDAYSSQESAESALTVLKGFGFIRHTDVAGIFEITDKVCDVPEAWLWAENFKSEREREAERLRIKHMSDEDIRLEAISNANRTTE